MHAPETFQVEDDYAVYRPTGAMTFNRAVDIVAEAIEYAREQGHEKLLVDTRLLEGLEIPSTWDRFRLGEEWARAAGSRVIVALIARPELIDPRHFGVTVARNRGTLGNVFTSEDEALAWLLDSRRDLK
jgi:hypothetical protein